MVKRVAVIGAGASGAAAAAALQAEDYFDTIKVFERREESGGTWQFDPDPDSENLPLRPGALPPQIDPAVSVPSKLPATTAPNTQYRFDRTPVYDGLLTNVPDLAMAFTDFPFPYGPFVQSHVPKQYIQNYFSLHRTDALLVCRTTVEDLSLLPGHRWKLVLRKHDAARKLDEWWEEEFDAVVLANGHYSVPYIPSVPGLDDFISRYPSRVEHSKTYRTTKAYRNKRVVVIGNSASGHDVQTLLKDSADAIKPIYVSRRSKKPWDSDESLDEVIYKPTIKAFQPDGTILFDDSTTLANIDSVIYCTGFQPSFPFWNSANNGRPLFDYKAHKLINTYQHVLFTDFPTLAVIGFPVALTFRSFEYQSIAVARLWAGRNAKPLPPLAEMKQWEDKHVEVVRKRGGRFHQVFWDNGETLEWFRWFFELAGLPLLEGHGRCPPILDERTRWTIEHVKRYPGGGPGPRADDGLHHDSLGFL